MAAIGLVFFDERRAVKATKRAKHNAPLAKRIVVKRPGSISVLANAIRHNNELAANASMAIHTNPYGLPIRILQQRIHKSPFYNDDNFIAFSCAFSII